MDFINNNKINEGEGGGGIHRIIMLEIHKGWGGYRRTRKIGRASCSPIKNIGELVRARPTLTIMLEIHKGWGGGGVV